MQPIIPGLATPPATALTLTGSVPNLRAWQVGQLLQAQVLTATVNNQVTLRIGPTTITAQTQTPLTAGQPLTVQVVQLGEQPVLKILPPAPPVPNDPLAAALRTALPKQSGLAPLLANLGLLAQTVKSATTPAPLPAPVMQAATQIFRNLSDSHQAASARGLQQAIRATGLFLESKLAQLAQGSASDVSTDFKAGLLRLQALLNATPRPANPPPTTPLSKPNPAPGATPTATPAGTPSGAAIGTPARAPTGVLAGALTGGPLGSPTATPAGAPASAPSAPATTTTQPAPPLRGQAPQAQAASAPTLARAALAGIALQELQLQTEGSLARLQLNQLASLPDKADPQPSWLLELPLRHKEQVDLFHLRIGREGSNQADAAAAQRPWVVNLAFDLPGLGPVQARVAVLDEQVSTTFWAEQPDTTQAFHTHLETLRRNLQDAGLGVGELACRTGQPPQTQAGPRAPLMDTRA